jgi:hypothetical protein
MKDFVFQALAFLKQKVLRLRIWSPIRKNPSAKTMRPGNWKDQNAEMFVSVWRFGGMRRHVWGCGCSRAVCDFGDFI